MVAVSMLIVGIPSTFNPETDQCMRAFIRPSKGYATPQPDPRIIGYNHIDVKMFLDMGFLWRRDRAYTLQSTPIAPGTWPHCTKAD
ncbi:hypothetical protein H9L39_06933 [Fusarium oxysporum f. sp. albedinis]|nr:hypothetical protein H9L39_06933 [Fusarium oxysporum f. sp. albedinis]